MRIAMGVVCFALAAGCGTSIKFVPTNPPPRSLVRKPASSVEVFTSTAPKRAHVEVGILEGRQASKHSIDDIDAVIEKMREEAGERGCDGLVITSGADTVASGSEAGTFGDDKDETVTLRGFRGTCIVYTGSPAATQPKADAAGSRPATACVPGASQLCYGPGGCQGGQACLADGSAYGPCDCGEQRKGPSAAEVPAEPPSPDDAQRSQVPR